MRPGGSSVLAAAQAVASGYANCVPVVGWERMDDVSTKVGNSYIASAACKDLENDKDPVEGFDTLETHDAFTISDIQTYEGIGRRPDRRHARPWCDRHPPDRRDHPHLQRARDKSNTGLEIWARWGTWGARTKRRICGSRLSRRSLEAGTCAKEKTRRIPERAITASASKTRTFVVRGIFHCGCGVKHVLGPIAPQMPQGRRMPGTAHAEWTQTSGEGPLTKTMPTAY